MVQVDPKFIRVVAALFHRISPVNGHREVLIFRRGPDQSGAGMWEFPGGKVDSGENDTEALQREIQEELSVQVQLGRCFGHVRHQYSTKNVELWLYEIASWTGQFVLLDHDDMIWVSQNEIRNFALAAADLPFIDKIFNIQSKSSTEA